MFIREARIEEKEKYNSLVTHPVQSWEWGEFKSKTGVEVERLCLMDKQKMVSAFQFTLHQVPKTNFKIGYFPKGSMPDEQMLNALLDAGKRTRAIFIKLEPNSETGEAETQIRNLSQKFDLRPAKSVFSPYTFILDLTKSEEELLVQMKPKTRYNIRVAEKNGVQVKEDTSSLAFETYLRLTRETAKRQKFYAHDENYHRLMWENLKPSGMAYLLTAKLGEEILVTWILFVFNNVLYYPYGASLSEKRNLMASNLMMWEAIKFGKRMGCTSFDMWGALGPNPDEKDPWYGFHRFKEGYGGKLIAFTGAYDLVINPQIYPLLNTADKLRWKVLRLLSQFR